MLVLAAATETAASWLPVIIGLAGLAGCVFTALKFNRDDTTAVLGQQDVILNDMKTINEELRTTSAELRTERDGLRVQVQDLTAQVKELRDVVGP